MTGDVIKGYNRDRAWLATGVLGAVVLAALVLAVEERHTNATQAKHDLLLNASAPAAVASVIAPSSNSDDKIPSGPASSVGHTFTEPALFFFQLPRPLSPAFTPETNRNAQRQDSARVEEPKDSQSTKQGLRGVLDLLT